MSEPSTKLLVRAINYNPVLCLQEISPYLYFPRGILCAISFKVRYNCDILGFAKLNMPCFYF